MSVDRTAVLLGAGASADAGLLLTSDLASAIVQAANRSERGVYQPVKPDWVRALNAVYAGMVGYKGARGDNPLSAVNIETLVSAVRLLRERDEHEVAPFVAAWTPALSNFTSSDLPERSGKAILDAVGKALGSRAHFAERDVTEAVATIARAAVRPDTAKPFADAETFILRTLVDLLGSPADVSYLKPLVELAERQPGGADIITLNYDLTVETAASAAGILINRGVETWQPGENLAFPAVDGVLNLMKLHGSLDWRPITSNGGDRVNRLSSVQIETVPIRQASETNRRDLPWIVVGDREKLATDGPTLALNFAAREALRRSNHLAVVGYSFGDAHINAMIRDWLAGAPERTIAVLDVRWPREQRYREIEDFRSALTAGYARQFTYDRTRVLPRMVALEGTAAERLGDALQARPSMAPEPIAKAVAHTEERALRFEITWQGIDLANATVNVWPRQDQASIFGATRTVTLYRDAGEVPETPEPIWRANLSFERWNTGETVTLYAAPDTSLPVEVEISGASIIGSQQWRDVVGSSDEQ